MIARILTHALQRVNNNFFSNVKIFELGLKHGMYLYHHQIKYFLQ